MPRGESGSIQKRGGEEARRRKGEMKEFIAAAGWKNGARFQKDLL